MTGTGASGGGAVSNVYPVKTSAVMPDAASGYSAAEIEHLLGGLDPAAVAVAGSVHSAAADTLAEIAQALVQHVQTLSGSWSGPAARSASGSFQLLHGTALGLAQASRQTGAVLSWLGETILPYYKSFRPASEGLLGQLAGDVEGLFGGESPQDKVAREVMARLNNRLVQANGGLPDSVSQQLPSHGTAWFAGASRPGAGDGGAPGAGQQYAGSYAGSGTTGTGHQTGGSAMGGAGTGGLPGAGRGAGTGGGSGTHLAGLPPGGGAPGGAGGGVPGAGGGGGSGVVPGGPAAPGTGSPGPGGVVPLMPGSGAGQAGGPGPGGLAGGDAGDAGLVAEVPGTPGALGPDGMISGAPGWSPGGIAGTVPPGAGPASPGGAGGAAPGAAGDGYGMPGMGASGGGQPDRERLRQAWLAEEADLWEPEPGTTTPFIGQ